MKAKLSNNRKNQQRRRVVLYLVLLATAVLGLERRFRRNSVSQRHSVKKQSREQESKVVVKKNESSFASAQSVTNTSVQDFFDCPDEWGICWGRRIFCHWDCHTNQPPFPMKWCARQPSRGAMQSTGTKLRESERAGSSLHNDCVCVPKTQLHTVTYTSPAPVTLAWGVNVCMHYLIVVSANNIVSVYYYYILYSFIRETTTTKLVSVLQMFSSHQQ